ncbi:MAG: hypothetical protein IJ691_09935 [Lachnospiraceae bacterium]|nr:hypothetical protein [Lachnospiraceae bacterium]
MGKQVILVLEADEESRSDYIYISSVLDEWYNYRLNSDVKITPIFMGGKGNYKKKKIINKINKYSKIYQGGDTYVVYCFDTDKYDAKPEDAKTLEEEKRYCETCGYDFVWFCHDIEEVFLGKSVQKTEKTNKAREYSLSRGNRRMDKTRFQSEIMLKGRSNLVKVMEKIFD